MNGNTGALTQTCPLVGSGISWFDISTPSVVLAEIFARGIPVALATKGTVLLDLGLTSKTYNSFS